MAIKKPVVFISYSNTVKEQAKIIKSHLLSLSQFDVFVAPDDIPIGSSNYLMEIREKIESCNIFLSLMNKENHKSDFTDQECGIALGSAKKILLICIDDTLPYGFLKNHQCICCKEEGIEAKLNEIETYVLSETSQDKKYVDLIVNSLCNAGSFNTADSWAKKLEECSNITEEQITLVKKAFEENRQIYQSYVAQRILPGIIKNYS